MSMPLGVIQCAGIIRMLVFAGLVCAAGLSTAFAADVDDPLLNECMQLLKKAPKHLQQSAAYGVIGFLSER